MYFPKLFNLITDKVFDNYSGDIITKIDDYLGTMQEGTTFIETDLNMIINNVLLTDKIISDLIKLGIIKEFYEDEYVDDDSEDDSLIDRKFVLLIEPNKLEDKDYQEYVKRKRYIDSFSIMYEKTKKVKAGALTLIDLKGYSKNVNNKDTNPVVLSLIGKLDTLIENTLQPYFLNSYSGIEIKQNGDGWFLYFLVENEAYQFLNEILHRCAQDVTIAKAFRDLGTTLKCYIHHSKEIEEIYKVDTLHFDMAGKDVVLIHMLEKPIESKLYSGIILNSSSFIAITENVLTKIDIRYTGAFTELKNLDLQIKDSDGNNKIIEANIKIFYKEYLT